MSYLTRCIRFALCSLALLLVGQAVYAAELTGNWNFNFDYGEGIYPLAISLEAKGEKVTGYHEKEAFEGMFQNGKLEISGKHYVPDVGYASTLAISGAFEGDQIKGDASWDGYQMTFVATRAK